MNITAFEVIFLLIFFLNKIKKIMISIYSPMILLISEYNGNTLKERMLCIIIPKVSTVLQNYKTILF